MGIQDKDMKNKIELSGILMAYNIKKDDKAKRLFAREGHFEVGDTYTRYTGFVDVLTDLDTNNYVRVNVDTEYKTYQSGASKGQPTAMTDLMEDLSAKKVDSYNKTKDVSATPTISVWGREPYHFQFTDNFYFKDGNLVESLQTNLGFANLTLGEPTKEPQFKNIFAVHGVVSDIRDEVDKDDNPTGRTIVEAFVPYSTGRDENKKVLAFKIPLVATACVDEEGDYDMGEIIQEEEQDAGVIGYSVMLVGSIRSWQEGAIQAPSREGGRKGRGKKFVETTQTRHFSELLLEGYDFLGDDGDLFDEEDIEDAIKARQIQVETKRKKAEEKASGASIEKPRMGRGGASAGASASSTGGRASGRKRSW